MTDSDLIPQLLARFDAAQPAGRRRLVALAGGPASGKSTLAETLADALRKVGRDVAVVPMDGFHLDNTLLTQRGLLARKGAPQTFDAAGFVHLVRRLKSEAEVIFPHFDRSRDIAIVGSGCVTESCDTVIVEGNYLLFDADPWRELAALWDVSVRIDLPLDVLRDRLVARWLAYGLDPQAALARAEMNDLTNARSVAQQALPADITVQ